MFHPAKTAIVFRQIIAFTLADVLYSCGDLPKFNLKDKENKQQISSIEYLGIPFGQQETGVRTNIYCYLM